MAPFISPEITDKIQEVENTKKRNEIALALLPVIITTYPDNSALLNVEKAFQYADEFMNL